jgi:hypothetical protein
LVRLDANGNQITKRDAGHHPEGVSLQDCRDNQSIQFSLIITNIAGNGNTLTGEVWATDAAADCSDPVQRGSGVQQCYRLENIGFPIAPNPIVNIPVKQMIQGLGDQSTLGPDGCRVINSAVINVWFLALAGTTANGQLSVPVSVDTQGPSPLSNVRVQPGDTRLFVAWDQVGEGGAEDITGALAYCDPNPVPAGPTDAGSTEVCTTPEAGPDADDADTSETPEPTCTTVPLEGGAVEPIPPPDTSVDSNGKACATQSFAPVNGQPLIPDTALHDKYFCGEILGVTGNTIKITDINGVPLQNSHIYAVAVAATDSFANVGQLSSPLCQWPEPTSDFWRSYRNAGGEAGGGFCSIEGPGVPVGSFGLMAVGIVVGCSTIRRIRRIRRCSDRRSDR